MSETKIKYVTSSWGTDIKRLTITRETAKFVWYIRMEYNGDAEHKLAKGENVHDSYASARLHLLTKANNAILVARKRLATAENTYNQLTQMLPEIEPEPVSLPSSGELKL